MIRIEGPWLKCSRLQQHVNAEGMQLLLLEDETRQVLLRMEFDQEELERCVRLCTDIRYLEAQRQKLLADVAALDEQMADLVRRQVPRQQPDF